MSRLLYVNPTASSGNRTVRSSTDGTRYLLSIVVENCDGREGRLNLRRTADRLILDLVSDSGRVTDRSGYPTRAVDELLGPEVDPHRSQLLLRLLADHVPDDLSISSADADSVLIAACFPAIRSLLGQQSDLRLPPAIPGAVDDLLTEPDPRRILSRACGVENRPSARRLVELISRNGVLTLRELAMLRAARGLTADHLSQVLEGPIPERSAPWATVQRDVAEAAGRALGRVGPSSRHAGLLAESLRHRRGYFILQHVGIAEQTGRLDLGGVKDDLRHLLERADEAIAEPQMASGPLRSLHGQAAGIAGCRFRVASRESGAELRLAGAAMRNCLGNYAPGGPESRRLGDDDAILLVVNERGEHVAAIEVVNGLVRQMLGPRNSPVPMPQAAALRSVLVQAGIGTSPRLHGDHEIGDDPF